jgi:hypothetical protein
MAGIKLFSDVLREAIADFEQYGFDNEERLEHWRDELQRAAQGHTTITAEKLKETLSAIYAKEVTRGGLLKSHRIATWKLNMIAPKLRNELDRRIMAATSLIKLNREEMVAKTIRRFSGWATSIPTGGSEAVNKPEANKAIKKALKSLPFEERRVMIDQAAKFKASLSNIVAVEGGAIVGVWKSHFRAAGYHFRPDHKARDGVFYVIRDNLALKQGLMKLGGHLYTDNITMPGEEVFCFPGESEIPFADGVEKAYRRWYSGQLAEIVTDSGKTLRATPNHPVLTSGGWKPIGLLNQGDYVIEIADKTIKAAKKHEDYSEPLISEIFGTLQENGIIQSLDLRPTDFHGDGANGKVDVVFPARELSFNVNPFLHKKGSQFLFTKTGNALSGLGAFFHCFLGLFFTAQRIMSRFSNGLSIFYGCYRHSQFLGGMCSTNNPASQDNPRIDTLPTDSIFGGDRLDGLPIGMKLCKSRINSIRKVEFSGHVYNLQTKFNWYSVNAIISHNCQCHYKYLYNLRDLPDDLLTNKGAEALGRKDAEDAD